MQERLVVVENCLKLSDNTAELIKLCRIYNDEAESLVEAALDRETITVAEGLYVLKNLGII